MLHRGSEGAATWRSKHASLAQVHLQVEDGANCRSRDVGRTRKGLSITHWGQLEMVNWSEAFRCLLLEAGGARGRWESLVWNCPLISTSSGEMPLSIV